MENIDTPKDVQYPIKQIDDLTKFSYTNTNTFFENYSPSEYTESQRILCTPSAFAKGTLFYIQEIGKLKSLKSHTSKRESLDSYLYIIVKSGSGVFTYEGCSYHVKSGDHIFIDCQKPYSHKSSDSDSWELVWVHFNSSIMSPYFDYFSSKNITPISKPDNSVEISGVLEKLMNVASNKGTPSEFLCSNLLNNLITMILIPETLLNSSPTDTINKIKQIKDFLDNNFQKKNPPRYDGGRILYQ